MRSEKLLSKFDSVRFWQPKEWPQQKHPASGLMAAIAGEALAVRSVHQQNGRMQLAHAVSMPAVVDPAQLAGQLGPARHLHARLHIR